MRGNVSTTRVFDKNKIWCRIKGFPLYDVSNLGQVRRWYGCDGSNASKFRTLKLYAIHGYFFVTLYANGKPTRRPIHQLVLEAFEGPCPDGMQVSHLDESRDNNRLSNLAYATPVENANMPSRRQRISAASQRSMEDKLNDMENKLTDMENKLNDIENTELDFSEAARVKRMVEMYDEDGS